MLDLSKLVRTQPAILDDMSPFAVSEIDEKRPGHLQQCHQCQSRSGWSTRRDCEDQDCIRVQQSRCHRSRLRHVLVPTLAVLLIASLFFALSYIYGVADMLSWGVEGVDGLARRATGDATNSNGGTFVNNKLYLIIIFVGLFLVLVLGIMLTAWCCRGSFENPLCCPCYLCACCGGLACLECIGCGLCAEGVEQM